MIVKEALAVEAVPVEMEGAHGVTKRVLISEEDDAPNFILRQFEIEPGGNTPYHSHDFEHEVYVLSGNGLLKTADGDIQLKDGNVVFVPGNEFHQFINTGEKIFRFLCIIPRLDLY